MPDGAPVIDTTLFGFLVLRPSSDQLPDLVRVPISAMMLNFTMGAGTIPTASFDVPMGRLVYTEDPCMQGGRDVLSDIAFALPYLSENDIVEAWVRVSGREAAGLSWPDGYTLVWRGYLSSIGYTRSTNRLACRLESVHWLKAVVSGTMLSEALTKPSYDFIMGPARMKTESGNALVNLEGLAEIARIASGVGSGNSDKADMWWTVLLPLMSTMMIPDSLAGGDTGATAGLSPAPMFFRALSKLQDSPCMSEAAKGFLVSGKNMIGNLGALQVLSGSALSSMTDPQKKAAVGSLARGSGAAIDDGSATSITDPCGISANDVDGRVIAFNNKRHIPIGNLKIKASDDLKLLRNLCLGAASIVSSPLGQASTYDKLATAGESFMFTLVANARSATLAPVMPVAFGNTAWRVLRPVDILDFNMPPVSFPETWAGVALVGAEAAEITVSQKEGGLQPGELAGIYIAQPDGKLHITNAPEWVRYTGRNAKPPTGAVGPQQVYAATGTTYTAAELKSFQQIGCGYSQMLWAWNNFNHRRVNIRTRLRFDIAPGSRIIVAGLNSASTAELGQVFTGLVTGVSISIDFNSASAFTSLSLGFLHSQRDETRGLIPSSHPLYDGDPWRGAPLVRMRDADMVPDPDIGS